MDTIRYYIAVFLVCTMPAALVWWVVIHPFVSFWRRIGRVATFVVAGAATCATIVTLFLMRTRLVGEDLGSGPLALAIGVVLLIASIRIALARRKYLTKRILLGVPELEPSGQGGQLLDQGIYSRIRHPRYVEIILGVAAYASFANHGGSWITAVLVIPGVHLVVLMEERELKQRFGAAYVEYAERVPRYLPRRSAGD